MIQKGTNGPKACHVELPSLHVAVVNHKRSFVFPEPEIEIYPLHPPARASESGSLFVPAAAFFLQITGT